MTTDPTHLTRRRPAADEYNAFYAGYVAAVEGEDVLAFLREQYESGLVRLASIPESKYDHRYAEGKWSVREVIGHMIDAERVFSYRALAFARGDREAQPGMDQDVWMASSGFAERSTSSLLTELRHLRAANLALFESLDAAAWQRQGTASGSGITVRALIWIIAGHFAHHLQVLDERYLG